MRVLSTNTGKPKTYELNGQTVSSSMRRDPTLDGISVLFDRVDGDLFAVPKNHGIREAVVYAYSAATFPELSKLYTQDVTAGNVGENLTFDELIESDFIIGDEYEVGEVRLRVSAPRYPCNRLNFCFQRENAMSLFADFRRPGVYFEVLREGRVQVGDQLRLVKSLGGDMSILQMYDHLSSLKQVSAGKATRESLRPLCEKIVANDLIPAFLRARFQKML